MSSASLRDIEADLTACVDELHQALTDGDEASIPLLERKAVSVLMERNRLCKLNKQ